jgi:signal transduction histidine kinase
MESRSSDPQRLALVLVRIVDSVCAPSGLRVEHKVESQALSCLSRSQVFHLVRVVRELASNAARHSGGRLLRFELKQSDAKVRMIVEDDGRGIPEPDADAAPGMEHIRKRVRDMGASIHWEVVQPQGTRVVVDLVPSDFSMEDDA